MNENEGMLITSDISIEELNNINTRPRSLSFFISGSGNDTNRPRDDSYSSVNSSTSRLDSSLNESLYHHSQSSHNYNYNYNHNYVLSLDENSNNQNSSHSPNMNHNINSNNHYNINNLNSFSNISNTLAVNNLKVNQMTLSKSSNCSISSKTHSSANSTNSRTNNYIGTPLDQEKEKDINHHHSTITNSINTTTPSHPVQTQTYMGEGLGQCNDNGLSMGLIEFSNEKRKSLSLQEKKISSSGHKSLNEKSFYFMQSIGVGSFGRVLRVKLKDDNQLNILMANRNKLYPSYKSIFNSNNNNNPPSPSMNSNSINFALKCVDRRKMAKYRSTHSVLDFIADERDEVSICLLCGYHPYIINLYDYFSTPYYLCMIFELKRGGSLADVEKSRNFHHRDREKRRLIPESIVKILAAQILLALEHIHKKGILFRDLKPDNVLLDENGNICLIDFGVAFRLTKKNPTCTRKIGARGFKAPEMMEVESRKSLDTKLSQSSIGYAYSVDFWNYGVLLAVLLTGKHPFASSLVSLAGLDTATRYSSYTKNRDYLSNEANDLLKRLLEKDVYKRLGCEGGRIEKYSLSKLQPQNHNRTLSNSHHDPHSVNNNANMPNNNNNNINSNNNSNNNCDGDSSEDEIMAGFGAAEVKGHPWFKGVDFEKLLNDRESFNQGRELLESCNQIVWDPINDQPAFKSLKEAMKSFDDADPKQDIKNMF